MRGILLLCGWLVWMPALAEGGRVLLDGQPVANLAAALAGAVTGSRIELGAGLYEEAGVIRPDYVSLVGEPGAVIAHRAAGGKAALVVKGRDTLIQGIECYGIKVADHNGACVRLEGRNLELDGVYFHDSEQGLLTVSRPGRVVVRNSRFERLGARGRAHGLYVGGGELYIYDSKVLAAQDEGHEVKSRARRTLIERSLIASLDAEDSRLLDIPNGGELIVRDSVLQQGRRSANNDMIGYGLEGVRHRDNRIRLYRNLFVIDLPRTRILHRRPAGLAVEAALNTLVGTYADGIDGVSTRFTDRGAMGLPPYPSLEGIAPPGRGDGAAPSPPASRE